MFRCRELYDKWKADCGVFTSVNERIEQLRQKKMDTGSLIKSLKKQLERKSDVGECMKDNVRAHDEP